MTWTRFYDMHSGGHRKVRPYESIYIEATSEAEAIVRFERIFGRDPFNVTCTCCGADYAVMSDDSLETATKYDRDNQYTATGKRHTLTLEQYEALSTVRIIRASELEGK